MISISMGLNLGSALNSVGTAVQSLLDLTDPIETSAVDKWNVTASSATSATLLDDVAGSAARGGWPMMTEDGVSYEVAYSLSATAGSVTGGDYVRVSPDQGMAPGAALAQSGIGSTSGVLTFTGNGSEVIIGPVCVCPVGTELTISNLSVAVA